MLIGPDPEGLHGVRAMVGAVIVLEYISKFWLQRVRGIWLERVEKGRIHDEHTRQKSRRSRQGAPAF